MSIHQIFDKHTICWTNLHSSLYMKKLKGVGILGKEEKKSKDKKKSDNRKEETGEGRQNEASEISLNRIYNEMRIININLEKIGDSLAQNSSTLSNLFGNLNLTKIIEILTVINGMLNPNQAQQTQSPPNMVQQVEPLEDMVSDITDSENNEGTNN